MGAHEKIIEFDNSCFKFPKKVRISVMDISTTAVLLLKGGRFFLAFKRFPLYG